MNERLRIDLHRSPNRIKKIITASRDINKCLSDIINFDETLFEHSFKVAVYSLRIGMDYCSDKEELNDLFIAALLHDYGKLYIPERILSKPGPLTNEERRIIEFHPMIGYFYLQRMTYLPMRILESIKDHHERVDGEGYGFHKRGKSINEFARIIAVSDVFDAMASDRVYRRKLSKEEIHQYLTSNIGKHFDRDILSIFLSQMDELIQLKELENIQEEFHEIAKRRIVQW